MNRLLILFAAVLLSGCASYPDAPNASYPQSNVYGAYYEGYPYYGDDDRPVQHGPDWKHDRSSRDSGNVQHGPDWMHGRSSRDSGSRSRGDRDSGSRK